MAKSSRWTNIIIEILKKSALNYIELFEASKKELEIELKGVGKKLGRRSERGFNNALLNLLYEGKIIVSGYDFGVHKHVEGAKKGESMGIKSIQTIKKEGLMFDLFRTDQTYVISLLNELKSLESTRKAREKLQRLFEIKYRQYETQEEEHWNYLKSKIETIPLKDAIKDLEEFLEVEGKPVIIRPQTDTQAQVSIGPQTSHEVQMLDHYLSVYSKNENANVWRLGELFPGNARKERLEVDGFWFSYLDDQKEISSPETFLSYVGFEKPIQKPLSEIRGLFNGIVFYISTHENHEFLKTGFSWALSDVEDSMDWFKMFIMNITSINDLKKKLKIILINDGDNEHEKQKQKIRNQLKEMNEPWIK